jgi:hypothetical protein
LTGGVRYITAVHGAATLRLRRDLSFLALSEMAKPAKKPATFVAKGITKAGRSQTYKRCAHLMRRSSDAYGRHIE